MPSLQSLRCRGAFYFHCFRISGPHLKFNEEVEALQVQVDKLETLGYNKIIALGHSGFDVDKKIAKRVRGVDVVIGGHTNTFLYTGNSDQQCQNLPDLSQSLNIR